MSNGDPGISPITAEPLPRDGAATISGIIAMVAGIILILTGAWTWAVVTDQLSAEQITVSDDASCAAGDSVDGPISAYCEAQVINDHALEATGGQTYATLDREDPLREVAMNASFLRASLFTSVVAYGVAAMAPVGAAGDRDRAGEGECRRCRQREFRR